jgi:hypothetical protein
VVSTQDNSFLEPALERYTGNYTRKIEKVFAVGAYQVSDNQDIAKTTRTTSIWCLCYAGTEPRYEAHLTNRRKQLDRTDKKTGTTDRHNK